MCLESKSFNLILALVLSAIFILLLFVCGPDASLSGIAAALFGAAGTIVALALPAAELGGQSVARIADYWLERTKDKDDPPNLDHALASIKDVKDYASVARRGSIYVLVSFFVAGFALLTPRVQVNAGQYLRIDYLLTGIASGFLLVGAVLFFPFAWSVYRLDTLRRVENYIKGLKSQPELTGQPADNPVSKALAAEPAQGEAVAAEIKAQPTPAEASTPMSQSTRELPSPTRED